ncbi:hypothetical protein [Sporosarcina psychrophila]|uniref:hypothetical protein n=1 Tax=Sporosarcina psychrophila TaxID=1476 RepID=UPI00078ECD0A|nr:hypothetical protein [Sporosarcina psychrophila]AMQ06560.1 hypothetical protein AZE41_11835 [Sporosarcina psychrophila]
MKKWMKYIVIIIYLLLLDYSIEKPKDLYFYLIYVPIVFGGVFLILYLFEKNNKTKNDSY